MNAVIKGAKKGSGSSRKPVIAPDSAQSKTFLKILYGLSEGPVKGLANGLRSIYLDDTPLQSENGTWNFQNVQVDTRLGTNDQPHIEGFPSIESETGIGVELKSDAPWVQAFSNSQLDAVRIRLRWGPIRQQNPENGDVNGYTIRYAIDLQSGGGTWTEVINTKLSDKTSANYERSHRIDLPSSDSGWQIRVRRITPNSTSEYISDKMYVQAVTEIVDAKLRYPNTALLGLQYDAETFSNVAKMAVELDGIEILVPTNYNPETRAYVGLWDGTFKRAYTNNPAWHFYDACITKRYALGDRINSSMIDKWSVYRLAQYCDQLVSDGKGGQEPRFTLNVYEQQQDDAWAVLSKMAGAFRAYIYWDGQAIVCDADIPQDTYFTYTRANVVDGIFEYSGTRARDRHTVAKVAWDNPKNRYKTEHTIVRDEAAIAKLGIRIVDIQAYGCTSEGQAQRAGQWALKSEQLETRTVSFKVGLDGFIPMPGKVIEIADELFAGRANGGRISAVSADRKVITLDRDNVVCRAGDRLVVNTENGQAQARIVSSKIGRNITVTVPFDSVAAQNIWVVDAQDLATMKFRVISITQDDKHQFSITALQYNPQKYDAIDHGAFIDDRPISIVSPTVQAAVTDVQISSETMVQQGLAVETMLINWTQASGATKYQVEWRKGDGNWIKMPLTGNNSVEVQGIYAGNYEARVIALSAYDVASLPTYSALTTLSGKTGLPPALANLAATGILFGYRLDWNFPATGALDTAYTEIEIATTANGANAAQLGLFAYPTDTHVIQGMQPNLTRYFRGRLIDRIGNIGPWSNRVSATTSADASAVLDILSGKITESQLHQNLQTKIDKIDTIAGLDGDIGNLIDNISVVQTQVDQISDELALETQQRVAAIQDLDDGLTQEITDRQSGDTANLTALNNYKSSNDTALANVQQQVNTAVTEAAANSEAVQALDSRVTIAEGNANTAKTNAATALTKAETATTEAGSAASLAQQASAVANQAADTADTANQNAATALSTANTAANQSSANASQINALTAELGTKASTGELNQTNANVAEIDGRVTANTTKIDGVYAQVNPDMIGSTEGFIGSTAGYVGTWTLQSAMIENDMALSQRIDTTVVEIDNAKALVQTEAYARAQEDEALSSRINTLKVDVDGNRAAIVTLETARATDNEAFAARFDIIQASTKTAQDTADQAIQDAQNKSAAAEAAAKTYAEAQAEAERLAAIAAASNDATAKANAAESAAKAAAALDAKNKADAALAAAKVLSDAAQATADEALDKANTATENIATIKLEQGVFTDRLDAIGGEIKTIQGYVDGQQTGIEVVSAVGDLNKLKNEIAKARLDEDIVKLQAQDAALTSAVNSYDARIAEITSKRTAEQAKEDKNQELIDLYTSQIAELNAAKVDANAQKAAISSQVAQITADKAKLDSLVLTESKIKAQYTIKLDSGGVISSYGLAVEESGGTDYSNFVIRADSFALAGPASEGSTPYYPFIFRNTPYTDLDTGTVFPVGAYMKSAFIDYASIDTAHIKQLAVKSAQIDDLAVTTGKIDDLAVTTGKIDDLAVTTAKIGDLQVDTLKIKGNAVTVSVSANNTESLSIATEGGKVRVDVGIKYGTTPVANASSHLWRVEVYRGSTLIYKTENMPFNLYAGFNYVSWVHYFSSLPPIVDNPPAGTHTYTVKLFSPSGQVTPYKGTDWVGYECSISLMEVKR